MLVLAFKYSHFFLSVYTGNFMSGWWVRMPHCTRAPPFLRTATETSGFIHRRGYLQTNRRWFEVRPVSRVFLSRAYLVRRSRFCLYDMLPEGGIRGYFRTEKKDQYLGSRAMVSKLLSHIHQHQQTLIFHYVKQTTLL